MGKYLDAIELSENLKQRLENIVISDISIKDKLLQKEILDLIQSEDGLISKLLIEGAFSAKKHDMSLREIPFLSKEFIQLLDLNKEFNPDYYPFKHQFKTLKITHEMNDTNKPAIVVTAPTGAGKTEAFLLPLLQDLVKNPRKINEKGVRAIILYPMNALVADQNKRLYNYLKGQSKIKMFFYNSETPETKRYATEEFNDECFIRTRKEARDNPPDIMITNYSMLEYILARPNDYPLIDNALRTIILDEAHLYTGTLAAEVSLLLRRVVTKANKNNSDILYIATTATISEDKQEQQDFFTKFFNKDNIVSAKGEKEFQEIDITININQEIEEFRNIKSLINQDTQTLYTKFKDYKIFPKILKILSEKYIINLNELLALISNNLDSKTFLNILTIGAKARINDNELPLLPHKLHLQVRSSQGFSICSNPKCSDSNIINLGKLHHGVYYNCTTCKSNTLNIVKCSRCSEPFFYAKFNDKDELFFEKYYKNSFKEAKGLLLSFKKSSIPLYINQKSKKCSAHDYHNKFYEHDCCPICSNNEFYDLGISDQFTLPLVAESMLVNMPEIDKESNIFLPAKGKRLLTFSDSRSSAARLGTLLTKQHEVQLFRKILVQILREHSTKSSDNELIEFYRNEISTNNNKLKNTDNPIICKKLQESINEAKIELSKINSGLSISELINDVNKHPLLGELFCRERMKGQETKEREQLSYDKNKEAISETIYPKIVEALITPNVKGVNLESLGLISFVIPDIDTIKLNSKFELYFTPYIDEIEKNKYNILNSFLYIFREQIAITAQYPNSNLLDHEFNKRVLGKYIVLEGKGEKLIQLKVTSRSSIYQFVEKILQSFNIENNHKNIDYFLESLYYTFLDVSKRDDIKWLEHNKVQTNEDKVIDGFRIVFYELLLKIPSSLYLNKIANTLWQSSVNSIVPERGIKVDLKEVSQKELDNYSYFSRYREMYIGDSLELKYGIWAEEHSAQLEPKENRRLQDLFISGKRNILSATTTLEVGIDIGGLSGVLMANIPPNKANYIQRSGRAGRRTDGSSIIVAYAKNRHFDQNIFRNFKFYMDKPHKKLTISLEKEKLVIRHFNSLMLSKFYEFNQKSKDVKIFDSFKKMGNFVGIYEIPKYTENAHLKFETTFDETSIYKILLTFLDTYIIKENDKNSFNEIFKHTKSNVNYNELIKNFKNSIKFVTTKYIKELTELLDDWNYATTSSHKNAIRYNLKQKYGESLIEIFSTNQILPKYGFPIDVKNLQVINENNNKSTFNLSRDSFLALSEYIPDSKILAGGMIVKSKGIAKHFTGENLDEAFGKKGFAYTCSNGHFFLSSHIKVHKCKVSNCKGKVSPSSNYLIPEHGYITSASDKLSFQEDSPQKVGRLEIYTENNSESDECLEYDDFIIRYQEKSKIYAQNRGDKGFGFAICTKCGYTEQEKDKVDVQSYDKLSTPFKNHSLIYSEFDSPRCLEEHPTVWRNHILMADMVTDAILIEPKHDIEDRLIARTLANALQLSGCEELGIDEREISSLIIESDGKFNILMYDTQSGGVGYVYDLSKYRWDEWIEKTKARLFIDEKHNEECLHGCIKCIITMNTNEPLPRRTTLNYLNGEEINKPEQKYQLHQKKQISKEDRLRRFKK